MFYGFMVLCFSHQVIFSGRSKAVDPFCYSCFMFVFVMLSCLLFAALWSSAVK